MIRFNNAILVALQAEDEPLEELPLDERSDEWWNRFWQVMGEREAKRMQETT